MTKTTFVNCNLFVGTEDEVKENAWFTVDDATGKITEVGQGEVKAADKTVDLDGQYVMSGLINAHTHIGVDPYAKRAYPETETSTTVAALENLRSGLQGGVTYLRSCAVSFDVDIKLKRERAQHPFEGPGIMPWSIKAPIKMAVAPSPGTPRVNFSNWRSRGCQKWRKQRI